ncbi:hypothetical protein ZEAMMB73_Zm00001d024140 [Zea mays]|uniref:Uncharacterized protein n=1 Tax=Zea mays TaxID=4577 RepID=A0A1D6IXQ8_MAIZE|nr:hypothetical protein ZEAMMB73_Zm00001d024140 [Zea mays]
MRVLVEVEGHVHQNSLQTLNGNQSSGSLPDEIGYLMNFNRLQIKDNNISGPYLNSFANLIRIKHLLVDNNNLFGPLPPELVDTRSLLAILTPIAAK